MERTGSGHWQKQVIDLWPLLNKLANRRFANSNTADEALLYAMDKLEDDNWRRVRAFEGRKRAKFSTYLSIVVIRLFGEFQKKTSGYVQAPQWVKHMGLLWETVFNLLCRQRMPGADVIEYMKGKVHNIKELIIIEEAVETIPAKIVNCGHPRGDDRSISIEDLENVEQKSSIAMHNTPEELAQAAERADLMIVLTSILGVSDKNLADTSLNKVKCKRVIDELQTNLSFSADERLLFRLVYIEGLRVSPAGRKLGMNAFQAHGKHRRLLKKIRNAFCASPIEQELKALCE